MALKKKTGTKAKPSSGENYFALSIGKKKKIVGIFLLAISILIFLSIISYSPKDESNLKDNTNVIEVISDAFNPTGEYSKRIAEIRNWLGLLGAYTAKFFIKNTLGFFSIIFPVILFIWGFTFFKKINFRTLMHTYNFLLIAGLILSSFFGVLKTYNGLLSSVDELYGNIGKYLGEALKNLFGGIGSIIFLVASSAALLVIAFDIKIERIFSFFKNLFNASLENFQKES